MVQENKMARHGTELFERPSVPDYIIPTPLDMAERACCEYHQMGGSRRHAFSTMAPILWNIFPLDIRLINHPI